MSKNFELLQRAEQERVVLPLVSTVEKSAVGTAVAPATSVTAPALPEMDERSREQLARLVQQLFLCPQGSRAVVLAAVEPANGCSWMTVHCAQILAAQVSGSVCVLDANLRHPSLHHYFSLSNHHGLSDALQNPGALRDFLHPVPAARNLWLMSCGSLPQDRQALLASHSLRTRIAEMRSQFDYLLIDAPPLNLYNDAILLAQMVDGLALVVAEQDTHKEAARQAVQELAKANVRLLGAVLNKRTFPIPQKIYDRL